jgi:hypothetical protein
MMILDSKRTVPKYPRLVGCGGWINGRVKKELAPKLIANLSWLTGVDDVQVRRKTG